MIFIPITSGLRFIAAASAVATIAVAAVVGSAAARAGSPGPVAGLVARAPSSGAAAVPQPGPSPIFPLWDGNTPLIANPPIHPDSAAMINLLYTNPNGTRLTGPAIDDAQSTFYTAVRTDPLVAITCYDKSNPRRVCVDIGKQMYLPQGVVGGANVDSHTSVLQPDGCTLYDFWGFKKADNAPYMAYYEAPYDACTGNGFVASPPALVRRGGATQGGASNRLGRAPVAELQTGTINHALMAAIACNTMYYGVGQSLGYNPPQYSRAAPGTGNTCLGTGPSIPYGSYVWSDVPPDNLPPGLDVFTKMICVALYRYGAVVDDTIGPWNGMSINTGWNQNDPAYKQWYLSNVPSGKTDPTACFPGGDWKSHIHVLDWTKKTR